MRLNRFNALVVKGAYYNISFSTTPHDKYRYQLVKGRFSERDNDYVILAVDYLETGGEINLYADGKLIKPFRQD